MSLIVPLASVPNQSLSIQLDEKRYVLRLHNVGDLMCIDISIDEETILQGHRLVGSQPIIPYKYLERDGGNFIFATELGDYPFWDQFGVTQTLLYITRAELEAIRGN